MDNIFFFKFVYDFRDDVKIARESSNWKDVHDFYATTFDSFLELNAAFKVSRLSFWF
jgi:E3 ubiquitin-protein ligase HECTD2